MGEGYHNFHHQFPMDYRNAYLWYQYDPTKWFIAACKFLGLASNLRVFPSNEIAKGALTMKLKHLKQVQESIKWPQAIEELPIVTWESCESKVRVHRSKFELCTVQEESKTRPLLLVCRSYFLLVIGNSNDNGLTRQVSGFIHDVSSFVDQHPGGAAYLTRNTGKDMTAPFFGGVYRHSNAAHNVRLSA